MKTPRRAVPSPLLALPRCGCGTVEIIAVAPGSEPVVEAGIVLRRGVAAKAWCAACWPSRSGCGGKRAEP